MAEKRNGGIIEPGDTPLIWEHDGCELVSIPQGTTAIPIDARPLPQTLDELKAFVDACVRKVLAEDLRRAGIGSYPSGREINVLAPSRHEDLPAWARHEETGGTPH